MFKYFLILLLFLSSCSQKSYVYDIGGSGYISDTVSIFVNEKETANLEKDEYTTTDNKVIIGSAMENNKSKKENNKPPSKNKTYKIDYTDNVDYDSLKNPNFGIIAYNVPEYFKVNVYSTIRLRISKNKTIESVIIGDRKIPIVPVGSTDKVTVEDIEVGDIMVAQIYADDSTSVDIKLQSNKQQKLSDRGYTEWVWKVRPIKSGNQEIRLVITIAGKDVTVYERTIHVKSNWLWSVFHWIGVWWQPILASIVTPILIPFFVWLYKKRKNRR